MKFTGLLTRRKQNLPGVIGVARVERHGDDLLRRIGPGDIAVIDQVDLDRRTAEALVAARAAAVVNMATSISGRFPNLGPEVLLDAGIPLVDDVGDDLLLTVRDGARVRLHEGVLYSGDLVVGKGVEQTADSVADQLVEAKAGMSAQLEAFSANTTEFLRQERALLLDGAGLPELGVDLRGRRVVVVAPGPDHLADLRRLRRFVKESRPVLIGVEQGADTLRAQGLRPDVIVGDPEQISVESLRCGAELVVPAWPSGEAPGLDLAQDLGLPAVTVSSTANPEDLALLLAEDKGAELIVAVGCEATLHEFLDRGRTGSNPSTVLTRLRLGGRLIDAEAVSVLHRSRVTSGAVALLLAGVATVLVTAVAVSGLAPVYGQIAIDGMTDFNSWVKGLFS
ncbi:MULTISPECIES: putative cytokinetic ring protein SteA [Actinoalloteichus]|uniref:SteA-like C-terminal domain-containing protein n=1 Tax=Actinoalloteichus fjordicus TaxID=1612552 RepID=A0AAC9LET4_9PSEU|nr:MULTISPECIES: putative cytokinetic ring protein SteA [Actinoalloteichus]APU16332.1 hypothetical protein UA74_21535 [Actinoalloteichus fjordicus]APU22391.1 hypothetical protein UA75_22010 [Actinoalloteichus sp. GBA129-24]